MFSSVCLLSHCPLSPFFLPKFFLLLPCQPLPLSVSHSPFFCLPHALCLSPLSYPLILTASLPSYSLFPSLHLPPPPSSPFFSSPLYCHVFAPDASCLSSVGRVSVMGPSRNSKHHSGIFFQAIAFCSNKGGVALASLSEWAYWP